MSLAGALADDLLRGLEAPDGAPRSVLLWLDPDGQFTRLRDALETELAGRGATLLAMDPSGSQLEVKLALLDVEAAGAKAIVHLPAHDVADLGPASDGRQPVLWAFVDYRYKGAVWGVPENAMGGQPLSLDGWLVTHGFRFSGGGARTSLTRGGQGSRLARYLARRASTDVGQLPQQLNSQTLNVAGDPRDLAIDLLLDAEGSVARWGDDAKDARDLVESTFGLSFSGDDPALWAEDLAIHFALVEGWDALGRKPDYPFAQRIPASDAARDATLGVMRNAILPRHDVATRLRNLVSRHDAEFSGLVAWASSRPGIPAAIPAIAERRVTSLLTTIEKATSTDEALASLETALPAGSSGVDAGLDILGKVVVLGRRADAERAALTAPNAASDLATSYGSHAWTVDAAFLEVMAACRDLAAMAPARRLAERVYAAYLDAVNQRFTDLVESEGSWPPHGVRSVRDEAAEIWQKPAKAKERRAVVVVDALRVDVARRLEAAIGPTAILRPVASTLPTTTPFGMTALLPAEDGQIGVAAGGQAVRLFDEDDNSLQEREGRKALLRKLIEGRGDTIEFTEVEALLQGDPVPPARYVVAFTYALDDRGHSVADTASLPEVAGQVPERLARVIQRLHTAGIARVDVVTDHGFLWLDPDDVDALGTPSVPSVQVTRKAARYAILADGAAAPELMQLALPFDPRVALGFPRGIRTLGKATWYLHGGVSLQETIIPHIVSQAAQQTPRVRVTVTVPVHEIAGATIPVRLAPDLTSAEGQLSLGGPTPIRVRLGATALVSGTVTSVADPVTVEVRNDSPELATALYLLEDRPLSAGTVVTITADDDVTHERLSDRQVTLVTDWE